ncbi:MAG: hypothetical protein KKG70_09555, partial [Proteobacteria bacterium]|nr:hypothetical protein [Pseudomonadota bacterium]
MFGLCNEDYSAPDIRFSMSYTYPVDQTGRSINAASPSSKIGIQARMSFLREGIQYKARSISCRSPQTGQITTQSCEKEIVGNKEFYVTTTFNESSMTFAGGAGTYSTDTEAFQYDYLVKPGINLIDIVGEAKIDYTQTKYCDGPSCYEITREITKGDTLTMTLYGVTIEHEPLKPVVINEQGFLKDDYQIAYQILPLEYHAGSAYLIVSENTGTLDAPLLEPMRYIETETSSTPTAPATGTLARGFKFEPNKKYVIETVLNPGTGHEIKSDIIPLTLVCAELDADLNNDQQITEDDDPMETIGLGLVVPLNLDDDDGDGVVDNIDGYDADGKAGNEDDLIADTNDSTINVFDDDLVPIKLTGLPTTLTEGKVVLEVIQGQEQIRVWTDFEKDKSSVLFHPRNDAPNPKKEWVLGEDIANISELPKMLFIEGLQI